MPKKISVCKNQIPLPMLLPELPVEKELSLKRLRNPIWTENKAKLIERYLYYFVLVTHHGTYIDGFAGPQELDKPEMWAAKLVLDNEPKWMRNFYLYEIDKNKVKLLEDLKINQPTHDSKNRKVYRNIEVHQGDFNELILDLLKSEKIKQKEATFCLLDQRTFECKWSTVKSLAEYKTEGNKIEIFYFLPNSWLDRALAGLSVNKEDAIKWWGGSDVETLKAMGQEKRKNILCDRFKSELGYKYALPFPIYEKANGKGAIMYYMIHASDHDDAPVLMTRAYNNAVKPKESYEQLPLLFPDFEKNLLPES